MLYLSLSDDMDTKITKSVPKLCGHDKLLLRIGKNKTLTVNSMLKLKKTPHYESSYIAPPRSERMEPFKPFHRMD